MNTRWSGAREVGRHRILRRTAVAVTGLGAAASLIACAGESDDSAGTVDGASGNDTSDDRGDHGNQGDGGDQPTGVEPAGDFVELLGTTAVLPTTSGERIDIAYGDQARLRELAAEDDRWEEVNGHGAGALKGLRPREEMAEHLDIDIYSADTLYRVGSNAQSLFLFEGNQDTDAVAAAAEESGWEADGEVLTIDESDTDLRIGQYASQLRLLDGSVLAGMRGADMERLDGGEQTLLDDEGYATVASCLGDPVAAVIVDSGEMGAEFAGTDAAEGPVAVGVFEGEVVQTVVCAISEEPASLADGIVGGVGTEPVSHLDDSPLSDWIGNVDVSFDGRLVKAVFDHSEDADADSLMDMARYPGLPGFR